MSIQTDHWASDAPAPKPERLVSADAASGRDEALERALRPKALQDYVGQVKAREQLEKSLSLDPGFARSHWALVKLSDEDDGSHRGVNQCHSLASTRQTAGS